jgi:hypothetical protein
MKGAYQRLQTITAGFKHLYVESKEVWRLSKLSPDMVTRRDRELIRTNKESVKKVAVFFVSQMPPVIGLLPIAVALTFPKHILSHHFWDDAQKEEFIQADRARQVQLSRQAIADFAPLLQMGPPSRRQASDMASPSDRDLSDGVETWKSSEHDWTRLHTWTTMFQQHKVLPQIDNRRARRLIHAHNICDSRIAEVVTPFFVQHGWLIDRAKDIVRDDALLLRDGLSDLTTRELQLAAFRRGFAPDASSSSSSSSPIAMKNDLDRWLTEQVTAHDRERILQECVTVPVPLYSYALVYLQAFNAATSASSSSSSSLSSSSSSAAAAAASSSSSSSSS